MNLKKEVTETQVFVGPLKPALAHDVVNCLMESNSFAGILHDLLVGNISAREFCYRTQIYAENELKKIEHPEKEAFEVENIS